jgi:sugar porter (SP) family MFS transporter
MGSLNVMPTYTSYFTLTTATKSTNTAISYVGGATFALFAGPLVDLRGRKEVIYYSALVTLVGGVIQGAAQNIGMFIAGRFIVGAGMAIGQTAAPTLVAETVPVNVRGFALGVYYAFWGVGTLVASGVCYGTQSIDSTYAWRIPSLLQVVPSILVAGLLFFIPESPRWLISRGRHVEARELLRIVHGAQDVQEVDVQYREIVDTLAFEKAHRKSFLQVLTTKANRKRLAITSTFSIIVMLPGTNIVTFYFGSMLEGAGIENPTTQLEINVILTSWTLVVAVVASYYADWLGRKMLCSLSLILQIIFLFMLAGLTAAYGTSTNDSGIYATIASIFLYNAAYAWGITPLTVLYPPECLSFDIRAVGMGIYTFTTKLCGLLVTMAVPFGLDAIGWKFYIVNACADILMVAGVVLFWVETKGLTLEEVDRIFDKVKREQVREKVEGEVGVDIEEVTGAETERKGSAKAMEAGVHEKDGKARKSSIEKA